MATGTVKTWNDRGFGFIRPDDGGDDIFVHARSLPGGVEELNVGDRLRYDERPNSRHAGKFEAVAVQLL